MSDEPKFYVAKDSRGGIASKEAACVELSDEEQSYETGRKSAFFLTIATLGILCIPALAIGIFNLTDRSEIQREYGRGAMRGAIVGAICAIVPLVAVHIIVIRLLN